MSDLNISLLPWQQEVWEDDTRFKIVAAGRRTGKSRLAAWLLIVNALQTDRGQVFYVAPTQGQARDIMWQTLLELGHPVIAGSHINNLQIKLINGATISLKGGDRPETMRGVSLKYLVLDEYADIKPEVWEQILRPALADQKGSALFIGTPMGRNHFYELYKYGELSGDDTYRSWHFTSYDNPLLDPEEINVAKKSMSSYAFVKSLWLRLKRKARRCLRKSGLQLLKKTQWLVTTTSLLILQASKTLARSAQKNSRLDNTAMAVVKVGEEGWFVENIIYGRWTLEETARKIFEVVRDYKPISIGIERGIAKQAVMSPLTDMMKRQGFFFRVEELTHGNQKKTDRIMWALQGRFEHGLITLGKGEWNSRFLDELFQFPDPLTHDDLVDALAYVDQLAKVAYAGNWEEFDDYEEIDAVAGY
jgi:predicted phage terminase large subunit-like protein